MFELFMNYYLRLLLPCADYFEALLVEHLQKIEKIRQAEKLEAKRRRMTIAARAMSTNNPLGIVVNPNMQQQDQMRRDNNVA